MVVDGEAPLAGEGGALEIKLVMLGREPEGPIAEPEGPIAHALPFVPFMVPLAAGHSSTLNRDDYNEPTVHSKIPTYVRC